MHNEKALDQFMASVMESRELVDRISADLENHLGVDPDHVHYGHVGDANHVLQSLRDIAQFLNRTDPQRDPE